MVTKDSFITGLQNLFIYHKVEIKDGFLIIKREIDLEDLLDDDVNYDNVFAKISCEEVFSTIEETAEKDLEFLDNVLKNNNCFEFPIYGANDRMRDFQLNRRIEHNDFCSNYLGYNLRLRKASLDYKIQFICNFTKKCDCGVICRRYNERINTVEELFNTVRICTAEIETGRNISLSRARTLIQSYLFNIAFNYNMVADIADFSIPERRLLPSNRPNGEKGQIFPYKLYNSEIVKYYYQGIATDIPFAQYLAFYHVIEFFFQSVSERELLQEISQIITSPSFSPLKKESLRAFYKKIRKKVNEQKEDGTWNEKNALRLCLLEYVKELEDLENLINRIDSKAIEYYRNNVVVFADDGKSIDFSSSLDEIYKNIGDRIYSTRNAIVHGKDGEKLRYTPFKHDKDLRKEIPLIRAVAELVIINSAKPMEE